MLSFIFDSIPDHRVTGRCTYKLADLLTIALLTYLSHGEDYVDMSLFAHKRARDFGLLADCGNNSPSSDTFERLFSAVAPEALSNCLVTHLKTFLTELAEKQIVIDGKKLRGTSPKSTGNQGDYLLNAYVSENHLFLAQEPLTDKENEIKAIPRLLDKLDIEDATISIDAIGTQVDIAQQIIDKHAHYFLAVKDNQNALHTAIKDAFHFYKSKDESETMEKDHGRIELRKCRILSADAIEDEDIRNRWPNLKTIAEVTSEVNDGDHISTCVRHYISDESFSKAAYYNMLARGHWSIENQLHWCLDVLFGEDASRARKGYAAQNLSLLRKLALQIVKMHPDKRSIKKKRFLAALEPEYLTQMLKYAKF